MQVKSKVVGKRKSTVKYLRLIAPYGCKATSKTSRDKYVNRLVNTVTTVLDAVLPVLVDPDSEFRRDVLEKIGEKSGLVVSKNSDLEPLNGPELVTLQNWMRVSTNTMARMKTGIEALRPKLRCRVLPNCIKTVIAKEEADGNLKFTVSEHLLLTNKEGSCKMCPYYRVTQPRRPIKKMIDRFMRDGTYEESQEWGFLHNKAFFSDNIDKGKEETNYTCKLLNQKKSNSYDNTFTLASMENGSAECWQNENETFFNKNLESNPIPKFSQDFVDQRYHALTIAIPSKKKFQTTIF